MVQIQQTSISKDGAARPDRGSDENCKGVLQFFDLNLQSKRSWWSWWGVSRLMMATSLVLAPFLLFRPTALECWDRGIIGRDVAARSENLWALASLEESNLGLDVTLSGVYQSPKDLCDELEGGKKCVKYVSAVKSQPFRCIVEIGDDLYSFEEPLNPTVESVINHMQKKQIIVLAVAIAFLTYFNIGTCREGWDEVLVNNILYLFGMGVVMYSTTPGIGFFSGRSPIVIVRESFIAFQNVHPMESTAIALSHFATYWLGIAAWFPGSVRTMLVWRLLYELVTASVNEYNHQLEHELNVRCMRLAFMDSNDEDVIDRMLREYIAAPFFVYLYLLPNFAMHWASNSITSAGFA